VRGGDQREVSAGQKEAGSQKFHKSDLLLAAYEGNWKYKDLAHSCFSEFYFYQ
jgi:hypothetical protein